ncbi:MAG: Hsp20/alpha crystallin family protein [Oscillochloridaceae bacterium]|nr:Hsp20/alpha crystallin family protein [Chloroflexaceae bacterium]MDW8392353.1 Hsp20/alpha crystallin family protein [Oscillochloridaceae bacterium]
MNDPSRTIRVIAFRTPFVTFETRSWHPPMNVYETDEGLVIIADLAGVNPTDLQVYVKPNLLVVQGQRQLTPPPGLRRIHRMEIGAGRFEVEVPIATSIDPERSEGHYRNGLLEIILPYASDPPQRVMVIQIEGGL